MHHERDALARVVRSTALYVVFTSQASGRFEDNAVLLEAEKRETESD